MPKLRICCSSAKPRSYLADRDYEIGRVIEAVRDIGKLDNTLIIYINGDSGADAEGLAIGTRSDGQGIAALASGNLDGIGRSGTGVLKVDGKAVATGTMERTMPLTVQWNETFDVAADTGPRWTTGITR
jgi:arylsulfatase A-like enzyme